jgi:hypothetical protein
MKRTIDYSLVWNEATTIMKSHREALMAIAGLFLFLPSWMAQFFAGSPDFSKFKDINDLLSIQQQHLAKNWMILLPTGLVTLFGSVVVLVLLTRKDLQRIGDALPLALKLLPTFFVLQLAISILLAGSVFVFVIPGVYVLSRFWLVSAILPKSPDMGFISALSKSWQLTAGAAWKAMGLFLVLIFIGLVMIIVLQITIGVILRVATSGVALSFLETGVQALGGSLVNIVILTVTVALLRHLEAQPGYAE